MWQLSVQLSSLQDATLLLLAWSRRKTQIAVNFLQENDVAYYHHQQPARDLEEGRIITV